MFHVGLWNCWVGMIFKSFFKICICCSQELPAEPPRQNGIVQKKKPTTKGYHDDSDDVSRFLLGCCT